MLTEAGALALRRRHRQGRRRHTGVGMGVATGDYDNDGFLDLYVTNVGHNVLYHNNGDGTFTDVTREAGVDDERWSTSAAFFDYDGDGLLDLFVGNYVDFTAQSNKRCVAPTGEPDYCTPMAYQAVPSRLFHNEGHGKFADVDWPVGNRRVVRTGARCGRRRLHRRRPSGHLRRERHGRQSSVGESGAGRVQGSRARSRRGLQRATAGRRPAWVSPPRKSMGTAPGRSS